jgi:hypothetical protein
MWVRDVFQFQLGTQLFARRLSDVGDTFNTHY